MKTVLITGCAGFLGSHLAEYYLKQGYRVVGVDNFLTGLRSNKIHLTTIGEANFLFIEADITQEWLWLKQISTTWLQSLEYVFHFASPASPLHFKRLSIEILWANTVGLSYALKFADVYKSRVIFASTSEVYGNALVSPQSENYWGNVNSFGPRSCYDEAKRFGEALIYSHNQKNNTQHGLVRIFNTYGPRMNSEDGRVVINFIQQALKNEPITVYGSGLQTRSFCYVDDLIEAIQKYAESSLNIPVNIGNNAELSILDLAKTTIELTGSSSKIVHKELPKDDPTQRVPDLTLARKELSGWKAKTSLEEGLTRLIESLKN